MRLPRRTPTLVVLGALAAAAAAFPAARLLAGEPEPDRSRDPIPAGRPELLLVAASDELVLQAPQSHRDNELERPFEHAVDPDDRGEQRQ